MDVSVVSAIKLSLIVGLCATLLSIVPAIFIAKLLDHKKLRFRAILNLMIFFPMVSPPVVTGYLLLLFLGRNSWIGKMLETMGVHIPFSLLGAIIASVVVGFPLLVMFIRAAFAGLDPQLEQYSLSSGHTPFETFMKVSLPLSFPGILAGAIVMFARSLGEFGATVVLAGNTEGETRTISLAIYSLMDSAKRSSDANTLLVSSIIISFLALIAYEACNRFYWKKIEWKQ
jgi:molybdate transport system permease protein